MTHARRKELSEAKWEPAKWVNNKSTRSQSTMTFERKNLRESEHSYPLLRRRAFVVCHPSQNVLRLRVRGHGGVMMEYFAWRRAVQTSVQLCWRINNVVNIAMRPSKGRRPRFTGSLKAGQSREHCISQLCKRITFVAMLQMGSYLQAVNKVKQSPRACSQLEGYAQHRFSSLQSVVSVRLCDSLTTPSK